MAARFEADHQRHSTRPGDYGLLTVLTADLDDRRDLLQARAGEVATVLGVAAQS